VSDGIWERSLYRAAVALGAIRTTVTTVMGIAPDGKRPRIGDMIQKEQNANPESTTERHTDDRCNGLFTRAGERCRAEHWRIQRTE
jgi:hypothetical protein